MGEMADKLVEEMVATVSLPYLHSKYLYPDQDLDPNILAIHLLGIA